MNRFGPHARRRWNIDDAWRYRRMVRHVDRHGIRTADLTPQFYLDAQDEVIRDVRYHGLPLGVWRRLALIKAAYLRYVERHG